MWNIHVLKMEEKGEKNLYSFQLEPTSGSPK
jgi:hypothetical protein